MASAPDSSTAHLPSSNTLKPANRWLRPMFSRLSISQKIGCGYTLALGIAVLGTTTGLVIGDRYYEQARHRMMMADDEGRLLSSLQSAMLEAQSDQRGLFVLLNQPQEFHHKSLELISHLAEAEAEFSKLKSLAQHESEADLRPLVVKYDGTLEAYSQKLKPLLEQIEPLIAQPQNRTIVQQLLLKSFESPATMKFDELAHELTVLFERVGDKQREADWTQSQAAILQKQLIAVSMLLSVTLAAMLAFYTSRAIARPLKSVTKVAQQVTQEANFDLQATVITEDEVGVLATSLNQLIQQVKRLLEEQKAEAEARLVQSEKMSSLGRMMAGVAHEINNPVNFICGNLAPATDYIKDIFALLDTYKAEVPNPPQAVQAKAKEIDLEFLEEDLPKLLESMQVGADRVLEIVLSLKNFSRLDEGEVHLVNLHSCIDSTLLILNSRLKNRITLVRNYGDIPAIEAYTGLLYQVFMNLLSNAVDALEEKTLLPGDKQIAIATERLDNEWVTVRIADNGPGIARENQAKIFETFFTTKPRGVGTGLGLAISHQIVVEKHHGKIICKSDLGMGTEFAIALPIKHPSTTASTPTLHRAGTLS